MGSVIIFNGPNSRIVPGIKGLTVFLAAVASLWAAPVLADPVADFYRGKSITVVSAGDAGGVHSTYAQLISGTIRKYIPGQPAVVIAHMSGAGGNLAMNYLHNVAPRDGSYLGVPLQDLLFNAKLGVAAVRYDGAQAHYLGGADVIRTTVMDDPGFIGEAAMRGLAIHPVPWQLQQDLAAQIPLYIGCDA